MSDDPNRSPLAHREDCDCCCGCDLSVEEGDYPKDDEGNPIYRPL